MSVDAVSLLSIWTSMNSWLTPAVLFLFLNLMIGTIAVTSAFTSHKPSHHHHQAHQLARAPSVLQRLKSINFYAYYHSHPPPPSQEPPVLEPEISSSSEEEVVSVDDEGEGPTLDEIYSRIKQGSSALYGRQKSDTKPSNGEIPVRLPRKIKKSASDKSAFNHFKVEEREKVAAAKIVESAGGGDEEVDAKADHFINKFKQQLKLQRNDSILRK